MNSSNELMSASELREAAIYDEPSGKLFRVSGGRGRSRPGSEAGSVGRDGYAYAKFNGKRYLVHRLVWLHVTGEWPIGVIDHINGNRSDNRFSNLRDASFAVNCQNRRDASKSSASGVLGVSWRTDKQKWAASIKVSGSSRHLGYFASKDSAQSAYLSAKRALHPGCAI